MLADPIKESPIAKLDLGALRASSTAHAPSFFGRMRAYFEGKIHKFAMHLRSGALLFTAKLGRISVENMDLIRELRTLQPYLVSWSNISDYMSPRDFHVIARQLSCNKTMHVLHSCNWTQQVYGTDIFDLNDQCRLYYFAAGLFHISMVKREMGAHHFRNVCSISLARKYVKKYFRYFFDGQNVTCGCMNGHTPLPIPSFFLRNLVTAYFTLAYSETGIDFGRENFDFLTDE